MSQNIKFRYMYRDESNYKRYGFVIFSNPESIPLDETRSRLEKAFSGSMLFNAKQVGLPELFFEDFPQPNDLTLHEFDIVEITTDAANDRYRRTIKQFVEKVERESIKGWRVIDPLDVLFRHK